ncbi:MAG: 3-dehydroquinate synthase [Vulcanimicrobiaceae bacterium]
MDAQEEHRDVAGERVINRDLGYPIVLDDDVRPAIADWLRARSAPWIVVCDAHPEVIRLARSITHLVPGSLGVLPFALGERHKRLATVECVLEALVAARADRHTLVLGVGGGVASDLFGCAAALYMRGVEYAHVATTLVAMADASIGGKTGVDLPSGKNLAGVFRDPVAVFGHVAALQTLPYRQLREGLAEIVKAAIIEGHDLFEALETLSPHPFSRWPWLDLIGESVKVKTMIVADDKHEVGMRELLNLGHTFAHGLERASGYRIAHGAGVALGLRAAGLMALRTGRFSQEEHLRVLATLALLGMPLRTDVSPPSIYAAMQSDKKKRGGRLRFVVPRAIGDVEWGVEAPDRIVREVLVLLTKPPEALG